MVIGAGWMGARAMTSTAGPGMSLMAEFTGLGYYAEVPAVIFDIQRAGPSTGLPTRTAQQDILSTAVLSHGDTKHPMLLPASVTECYTMAMDAFDLAERLQTPVFVMSDLDLGMNTWMAQPFDYPTKPFDRGKRLDADTLKRLGEFGRIGRDRATATASRTARCPATAALVLHARLRPQREGAVQRARRRLRQQPRSARAQVRDGADAGAEARGRDGRPTGGIGLIACGTTHWAIVESRDQLAKEAELETSYLRLRAYPFTPEVWDFIDRCDRVYVVEQNRDGQMLSLLKMECTSGAVRQAAQHPSLRGLPIDGRR